MQWQCISTRPEWYKSSSFSNSKVKFKMDFNTQKFLLSTKAKIIHFDNTYYITASCIAETLGYRNPNKYIHSNVPDQDLKTYHEIKTATTSLDFEMHPTTRFISHRGLCTLLQRQKKQELLHWIETELFKIEPAAVEVELYITPSIRSYDDINNNIIKIYADGVWWMLANAFGDVLGYIDANNAVRLNVSPQNQIEYKQLNLIVINNKTLHPMTKFINEAGLYELILKSKMPNAKDFKNWVIEHLLPTLHSVPDQSNTITSLTEPSSTNEIAPSTSSSIYTQSTNNSSLTLSQSTDNLQDIDNSSTLPHTNISMQKHLDNQIPSCSRYVQSATPVQEYQELIDEIIKINFDGTLWMLASPLTSMLGYEKSYNAIRDHVSPKNCIEYGKIRSVTPLRPWTKFINETGLYELILNSQIPNAENFKKWVTDVLLSKSKDVPLSVKRRLDEQEQEIQHQKRRLDNQDKILNNSFNHLTSILNKFAEQKEQILGCQNELSRQIINLQSSITTCQNDGKCLEVYYKLVDNPYLGSEDLYCYHALRTSRSSLKTARVLIQPGFRRFYYSECPNIINAYNSIKNRIHYNQFWTTNNKIFCNYTPELFMKAIDGEYLMLRHE